MKSRLTVARAADDLADAASRMVPARKMAPGDRIMNYEFQGSVVAALQNALAAYQKARREEARQ